MAQEMLFEAINIGEGHVAVDLSAVFSKSKSMKILRKEYNRFKLGTTQFNLAPICDPYSSNVEENSVVGMGERFESRPPRCW